ncbi:hypothetical protein D3C71_1911100 [compost metagenome]
MFLQQCIKCAPCTAEVIVAAVTQRDQSVTQLWLVADPIANSMEQRCNAVRQIALTGGGGNYQRVMLTVKLPGFKRALLEQFDLMPLFAEDIFRFFRHQQ